MANEKYYRNGLILLFISMCFVALYAIIAETNVYYKQPGTEFEIDININSIVEDTGAGYIILIRNSKTPSTLELVNFADNKRIEYFSIASDEKVKKVVYVKLPRAMESGEYYFDAEIYLNNKIYLESYSFKVR